MRALLLLKKECRDSNRSTSRCLPKEDKLPKVWISSCSFVSMCSGDSKHLKFLVIEFILWVMLIRHLDIKKMVSIVDSVDSLGSILSFSDVWGMKSKKLKLISDLNTEARIGNRRSELRNLNLFFFRRFSGESKGKNDNKIEF